VVHWQKAGAISRDARREPAGRLGNVLRSCISGENSPSHKQSVSLNVNLVRPNICSVVARSLPTRPFRTAAAAQSKRANRRGSIRVARVGSFHQSCQTCRILSGIARQSFMNCDIERRKSFDVNRRDFAYSDILQRASGSFPERSGGLLLRQRQALRAFGTCNRSKAGRRCRSPSRTLGRVVMSPTSYRQF